MLKKNISLFVVFFFFSFLFSQTNIPYLADYYIFENEVFQENLGENEMQVLFENAIHSILLIEDDSLKNTYLSRSYFYRGFVPALSYMQTVDSATWVNKDYKALYKIMINVKDIMYSYAISAQSFAQDAVNFKPTADGLVTLAVLRFMNSMNRNPFSMLFAWINFTSMVKRAAKIEPSNVNAQMLLAAIDVMPPPQFGNLKRGMAGLEKLAAQEKSLSPKSDDYLICLLFVQAFLQLDNVVDAQKWLDEAKKIYDGVITKIYAVRIVDKASLAVSL
ncbi:MAG: hypothetical protein ACRC4W_07150 [Treponemataceae bacterium]